MSGFNRTFICGGGGGFMPIYFAAEKFLRNFAVKTASQGTGCKVRAVPAAVNPAAPPCAIAAAQSYVTGSDFRTSGRRAGGEG